MTYANDAPNTRDDGGIRGSGEADEALRDRLQTAWQSIQPTPAFVGQLQQAIRDAQESSPSPAAGRILPFPRLVQKFVLPAAAAAAAIVLFALILPPGGQLKADQQALRSIHEANLEANLAGGAAAEVDYHPASDIGAVRKQLARHLHEDIRVPNGPGLRMCGWATPKFRGRVVGSYLVEVHGQPVSVIVARAQVEELHFDNSGRRNGRVFFWCGFGDCRMAAVQMGELVYVSVGEKGQFSHEALVGFLRNNLTR
jgi:hypothetical protein